MNRSVKELDFNFSGLQRLKLMAKRVGFLPILVLAFNILGSSSAKAASGEEIYNTMCMSCHSLTDKVLMGPGFQGLSERRDEAWIIEWVKNPQAMIDKGDEYAVELFNFYNKVPMPGFSQLSDDEIRDFIKFVDSQGSTAAASTTDGASKDKASTATDTAVAEDDFFNVNSTALTLLILSLIVIGFVIYRFKKRTFRKLTEAGYHGEPHYVPNYAIYFALFIVLALGISYVLIGLLKNNVGMIDTLMFMVLPYLAFGIFLIGSIYRYTKRGYQVSSLSSQFLEGRKLFWGSQPFHWGLLILFFGHLIAFLFPRAVLAWNGEPVRLLILEYSSFAFGLSAFLGLILLIKRRLTAKKLLVVSNKMDMVVYTVLFTQIITGLGVAFFVRWGSSWFSSVLTPYLRSIFSFNPDINAVSEMPWLIQLHVISAFLIIAIIPFTRFMHFLVAPVDYLWRRYQLVIWNWNPKIIRKSTKYNFGKKSRNH